MPYSDSELLLSLFGVGLYHFNKNTGECREFLLNWGHVRKDLFLRGNSIRLFPLDEDCFCLLSDNHLSVYNRRKQQFEPLPEDLLPQSLLAPRFIQGDSCYISSSAALYVLDIPHKQLRPLFVMNEDIGTILAVKQDKDNRFWLGTSSGLYVYDRLSERLDTVDQDRFIGVTSLAFDRSDRLWISTHEGLYAYVPDEKRVIVFWGI